MENISRNFHIKGGISAINQWFTALEVASPEGFIGDIEKNSMKIEETQWWLANIAMLWWPLIPTQEREYISEIIGNIHSLHCHYSKKAKVAWTGFQKYLEWSIGKLFYQKKQNTTICIGLQHLSGN